jgi:transmembrane sensor
MELKLLRKFANNRCTPAEVDTVFKWINEDPNAASGEPVFRNLWDELQPDYDTEDETDQLRLDKIHHKISIIRLEQSDSTKVRILPVRRTSFIQIISRVAVILLIPVITLFVYIRFFQSQFMPAPSLISEIIAPSGSRTSIELSDGTKVWLNQGSKMVYPQKFTGKIRAVQLSGEGYFDIAPDKAKPFIVESGEIAVQATGTMFNVKAYADEAEFETSLESGAVTILRQRANKSSVVHEMKPGQRFVLNKTTHQYSLETEDLTRYVSWKEGKLIFKDDPLDEVARRLSRWYNAEITIKDPEINELTYTATFADEPLEQVLDMIEEIMPVSFTVPKRTKTDDGAFAKKKVLIYRRNK